MPLTSKLQVVASASLRVTQDLGEAATSKLLQLIVDLADGTGTGQADRIFADTRTLAASANEDLDLAGPLFDPFGVALTFVKIKGLFVKATGVLGPPAVPNVNDVLVGGAATNAFLSWVGAAAHQVRLRPGAAMGLVAAAADASGYAVTAGTGDLLRVTNGGAGTSVTYDIVVIGTSA